MRDTNEREHIMSYSNWKLRRQVMAFTDMTETRRLYALIIVDHLDWNTGTKQFYSRSHYENWLKGLAESYGIKPWYELNEAIKDLASSGFAEYTSGQLQLFNVDWTVAG